MKILLGKIADGVLAIFLLAMAFPLLILALIDELRIHLNDRIKNGKTYNTKADMG